MDDGMRRLERAAAAGDVVARSALARARQRAGNSRWDDHLWAMSDSDLEQIAIARIEALERDAQRKALVGYSAGEREIIEVAQRRLVLPAEWTERLDRARQQIAENWLEARTRTE